MRVVSLTIVVLLSVLCHYAPWVCWDLALREAALEADRERRLGTTTESLSQPGREALVGADENSKQWYAAMQPWVEQVRAGRLATSRVGVHLWTYQSAHVALAVAILGGLIGVLMLEIWGGRFCRRLVGVMWPGHVMPSLASESPGYRALQRELRLVYIALALMSAGGLLVAPIIIGVSAVRQGHIVAAVGTLSLVAAWVGTCFCTSGLRTLRGHRGAAREIAWQCPRCAYVHGSVAFVRCPECGLEPRERRRLRDRFSVSLSSLIVIAGLHVAVLFLVVVSNRVLPVTPRRRLPDIDLVLPIRVPHGGITELVWADGWRAAIGIVKPSGYSSPGSEWRVETVVVCALMAPDGSEPTTHAEIWTWRPGASFSSPAHCFFGGDPHQVSYAGPQLHTDQLYITPIDLRSIGPVGISRCDSAVVRAVAERMAEMSAN